MLGFFRIDSSGAEKKGAVQLHRSFFAAAPLLFQSTISTETFTPVRWAQERITVRISLAMRP